MTIVDPASLNFFRRETKARLAAAIESADDWRTWKPLLVDRLGMQIPVPPGQGGGGRGVFLLGRIVNRTGADPFWLYDVESPSGQFATLIGVAPVMDILGDTLSRLPATVGSWCMVFHEPEVIPGEGSNYRLWQNLEIINPAPCGENPGNQPPPESAQAIGYAGESGERESQFGYSPMTGPLAAFSPASAYRGGSDAFSRHGITSREAMDYLLSRAANRIGNTVEVAANYTATDQDYFIGVDTVSGAFTITLPTATGFNGKELVIKDVAGNASSNNITLSTDQTIDGNSSHTISTNFGAVHLIRNKSNYWII